jgi:hypothetical protein
MRINTVQLTTYSPISVRLMPLLKCKVHRLTVALEGGSRSASAYLRWGLLMPCREDRLLCSGS